MRAAFERVFDELQSQPEDAVSRLDTWAKLNPTEFYRLASKLLPIDMAVQGGLTLNVITGVPDEENDASDLV